MPRLLIVDSTPSIRRGVYRELMALYTLAFARSARDGRASLRREPADLIIVDAELPDRSGLSFLAELLAADQSVPVVVLASRGSESLSATAFRAGARDYFSGPVDGGSLARSIGRLVPLAPAAAGVSARGTASGPNGTISVAKRTQRHANRAPAGPPRTPPRDARPWKHANPTPAGVPRTPAVQANATRADMGRPATSTRARASAVPGPRGDDPRIASALEYVSEHYGEPLTLGAVARRVGLGRFTLSHRFAELAQVSFRTFLGRIRVEKAKELLEKHHYSMSTVAERAGFGDISRFNKLFRKYAEITPSAYRARFGQQPPRKKARSA